MPCHAMRVDACLPSKTRGSEPRSMWYWVGVHIGRFMKDTLPRLILSFLGDPIHATVVLSTRVQLGE